MEHAKPTTKSAGRSDRSWLRRLGLVLVILAAAVVAMGGPAAAAPANSYAQLRLLMEALHEVEQKYVGQETDADLVYGAIRGMVMALDPTSSFLTPKEYQEVTANKSQEGNAGLTLALKDNVLTVIAPVEDGPAWKAGVRAGDHILKLDNQSTRNLTPLEAEQRLQGEPGKKVGLNILRNGALKPLDLTVTLERPTPSTVGLEPLDNGYYYLRIRSVDQRTAAALAEALKKVQEAPGVQGVILDLRETANGGMEQAAQAAGAFLGDKVVYYAKGRNQDSRQPHYGTKAYQTWKRRLPLVVLIDSGTARAAEVLAGALQNSGDAVLLGYKTFGLAAIDKVFPMKDGSALIIPVAYVLTPKGHQIQGHGLEPDVAGPSKDPWEKQTAIPEKAKPKETVEARNLSQDPLIPEAIKILKNWGKPRAGHSMLRAEVREKKKKSR